MLAPTWFQKSAYPEVVTAQLEYFSWCIPYKDTCVYKQVSFHASWYSRPSVI